MSLPPSQLTPDPRTIYGDCARDITRQVAALATLSAQRGVTGYGYAGSQKVIDYDAIMAGRLGAVEKEGLEALAKSVQAGDKDTRRGSREGMSDALPLLRRYDTRCFALEVLGDGEEEEEMEVRVREQRQKRKQQKEQQQQQELQRHIDLDGVQEGGYGGGGGYGPGADLLQGGPEEKQEVAEEVHVPNEGVLPMQEERGGVSVRTKRPRTGSPDWSHEDVDPEDMLEEVPDGVKSGKTEKGGAKKAASKKRRGKKGEGYKPTSLPGKTIQFRGKDVVMPRGWEFEEIEVRLTGENGEGSAEKVPVFMSPEGIVCFSVEMMEGCESTRRKPSLNFERSLDLLRMDVVRLAKQPVLGELSDKAMGRDSVLVYRRGVALQLKAQMLAAAGEGKAL